MAIAAAAGILGTLLGAAPGPAAADFPNGVYPLTPGDRPTAVAAGDFDGDGLVDLATANSGSAGTVAVALANGDGSYNLVEPVKAGAPYFVAAGHLDGDAAADVAVANLASDDVTVLLGVPGDTAHPLRVAATVALGLGAAPSSVVVADLNHDGHADLAVTELGLDRVAVLYGDGTGQFPTRAEVAVGSGPVLATAADFDGDGTLDLAVVESGSNEISLLGGANGGFVPRAPVKLPDRPGSVPVAVTVANVVGSPAADLVVAALARKTKEAGAAADDYLYFFGGNGDGTFTSPTELQPGPSPATVASLGDRDGDGRDDLVLALGGDLVVLLSGPGYTEPLHYDDGRGARHVLAQDVTGDGVVDLVAANQITDSVVVLAGSPPAAGTPGVFGPARSYPVPNGAPGNVVATDIDGDGFLDLVSLVPGDNIVYVQKGMADGRFAAPVGLACSTGPCGQFLTIGNDVFRAQATVATIRLNADASPDLVVVGKAGVVRLQNLGDGTFSKLPTCFCFPGENYGSAVADIDGDGFDDIAFLDHNGNAAVAWGQANGGFVSVFTYPIQAANVRTDKTSVVVADANGDGRPDLVVTASGSAPSGAVPGNPGAVAVVPQTAARTFGAATVFAPGLPAAGAPTSGGTEPRGAVVGDFNGDGRPDLAVVNYGLAGPVFVVDRTVTRTTELGSVGVLLGDPAAPGGFRPPVRYPLETQSGWIGLADFNGDGRLDVAATNDNTTPVGNSTVLGSVLSGTGTLSVLLNNGDGSFDDPLGWPLGRAPESVAVADFDNDSHLDVAAANTIGTSVSVLLGIPDAPPSPPAAVAVYRGDTRGRTVLPGGTGFVAQRGYAEVDWLQPVRLGGSNVRSYDVTVQQGGQVAATRKVLAVDLADRKKPGTTFTGLTDGVPYTFTVTATNATGTGLASAPVTFVPAAAPSAPQNVTATAGDTEAAVRWDPPADDGGAPVREYVVTIYAAGKFVGLVPAAATDRSATATGLTNGTAYTFTVTARNLAGAGAESPHTDPVTPSAAPVAPVAPVAPPVARVVVPPGQGYRLVGADGGVFAFGRRFLGSTGLLKLHLPIVGAAATPSGNGYLLAAADGGVFAFGDARFRGSLGLLHLNQPIVGVAVTPSGNGYWLAAADGGVFAFGDAAFLGSAGGTPLNKPVVGMAATPSGKGYWLVAADGGVFAFGDAHPLGSLGSLPLSQAIVGMAATASGDGYWLVAADGGVFAFGDAPFHGSTGAMRLNQPVVGMGGTPTGDGYWLAAADGGVFAFGDAGPLGSAATTRLARPIAGVTT
ncbi:MAG TPA: FG-GAP-like repeat-containing protein [Acidimicrobiales bacterium]|nr:FG-GAP-like repeat-containing protein [Acidimicrobiales bacterium]